MFKVRVIPCLDVKDGRVVKGVNFVDLRELRPNEEFGIVGAIVGRALYDGRVTVPDAIRVLKGE